VSARGEKLMDGWLPTKVIIADFVEGVLTTDPGVDIGPGVGRLEVLVRRDGRPVGMVSLDVRDEPSALTPDLEAAAARLPAAARPPWPLDEPATWPKVTVAIPTVFGRMEMLCLAVASLARLDYPDFDIVLVDNRPLPREEDHARVRHVAGRPIEILHEPERGISAARNRAVVATSNPYIAFTDDDVQVESDWLRQIVRPFLDDVSVACVSGLVIPTELSSPEQSQFEHFYGGFHRAFVPILHSGAHPDPSDPLFPYAPGKFGTGNNMAFRVSALNELGGFDTSLGTGTPARGGEDLASFIAVLLAGKSIAFEPSAVIRHSHRGTNEEFRHQVFSYGVGLSAMYTSLLMADRRHRRDMFARLPSAVRLFLRSGNGTVVQKSGTDVSAPTLLRARQAAGILAGPVLYLRSRRAHPRSSRPSWPPRQEAGDAKGAGAHQAARSG
jgi:GT2 family glycosyltransferase